MTEQEQFREEKLVIALRLLRVNGQLRAIAEKADAGTMTVSEVLDELKVIEKALIAIDPELTISNLDEYQANLFDNELPDTNEAD